MILMIRSIFIFFLAIMINGCAGIQTIHITPKHQVDRSKKYMIFPFRNPSFGAKEFPGVGMRFTNSFMVVCTSYGLNVTAAFGEKFQSSKDMDIMAALAYARRNQIDLVITGQVTKWIDRSTGWTGKRDFTGLAVFIYEVTSGNLVFSGELQQHSNIFWSGTPDDFVNSLSRAMVEKLLRGKIE